MKRQSIGDFAYSQGTVLVNDIRDKFEEAWFGRKVSPEPAVDLTQNRALESQENRSFREAWLGPDKALSQPKQQEMEIDR